MSKSTEGYNPEVIDVKVTRRSKPATDPENREKQMIDLAINLAEKQLLDGTASPSTINHFLKLGTTREKMEKEILMKQAVLLEAKSGQITSSKEAKELTEQAIAAMKNYSAKG